ncbi:MAG: hypothetical protein ACTILK_00580 [Bifidobacterium crudilactis]|uniref:hypothetical protein n=1 Tax=Bifidobacterium crudilactis TaxID=327277 RepID=UPI003F963CBA
MTVKSKPTVLEAVSAWGDPFDQAQTLQYFANKIDEQASKFGSTELEAFQVLKVLRLNNAMELAALREKGLRVYRKGNGWTLDSRDFRRWTAEMIAKLSHKPRPAAPTPPPQSSALF